MLDDMDIFASTETDLSFPCNTVSLKLIIQKVKLIFDPQH